MRATLPLLRQYSFPPLRRKRLETLQVNVGYRCNQSCVHCHVNAGPQRTETMSPQVIEDVIAFLPRVEALDITGGAPEMSSASTRGRKAMTSSITCGDIVSVRCGPALTWQCTQLWLQR